MQAIRTVPGSGLNENNAIDPFFDGFKKAYKKNSTVIVNVRIDGVNVPHIFKCDWKEKLVGDFYACYLLNADGGIVALCRMDEMDS